MVDSTEQKPDAPFASPRLRSNARLALWVVLVLGVGLLGWFIYGAVRESEADDRWEELWTIRKERESAPFAWTYETSPSSVAERDEFIAKLEKFLADAGEKDAAVAGHVHMMLANLHGEQVLALGDAGPYETRRPHYEAAIRHLRTVIDKFSGTPAARPQLKPRDYVSEAHRMLATLEKNKAWDASHGLRDVEPDADRVVLLRTDRGDVQIRLYAQDAKEHVRRFVERVCAGALDGTRVFHKQDADREKTLRVGDARTKKADATEEERAKWVEATDAATFPSEPARHKIVHRRGTVAAWAPTPGGESDAEQFLLVVEDSFELNHDSTPFGRATDDKSLGTLARIYAERTYSDETPDIRSIAEKAGLADQLKQPAVIVRALLYEKGELAACHDATKVSETEKRLSTVVVDELKKEPPPPPAPAPAPAPAAAPAPAPTPAPAPAPTEGGMTGEPPAMEAAR